MPGAPILLTGVTGYIGGRLLRVLEEGGRPVRCLARQPERVASRRATTEVVAGDCLDEASLAAAMDGVDQAYYLVHSMAGGADFAERDRQAAENFGRAARNAGVRRIIYLGGLADDHAPLSTHLKSRVETGQALRDSGVPVIEFRASIVIGAGSLSFEMIRALVERLPAMICPRWVETRTQPIAIDDVLAYLRAALDLPEGPGGVFEIGGPEVVSYGGMMREYAKLRGLKRALIPVPVLTPRLSGLWLGLVTPAQARVGRALVEGLRNATVVRSAAAAETFAIQPMALREAFVRAIDEGGAAQFKSDTRFAIVEAPPRQAFAPIRRIGGATGWYFADALWRLRGWMDASVGGAGMPRTRRDPDDCLAGDVIDGWHVEACEPDRLLRLAAGLKLPGRGWLELRVDPIDGGVRSLIRQTATFDPKGLGGRLYWYAVLPLHALIFRGLLRRIVQRAVLDGPVAQRDDAVRSRRRYLPICLALMCAAGSASAQTPTPGRLGVAIEGLNVWQQRNDVRVPSDGGTDLSLVGLIGSAPTPSVRITATADVTERQQLRFVYAPLRLNGQGTPAAPVAFAGTTFNPAPTEAEYKFSSYRATWSYRVYQGETWTWRIGFTGFVRDARIALAQADRAAEDTDVGFVPLAHVSADIRLSPRWSAGFELDGSAAPQGRAFDAAATMRFTPAPRWTVFGGYRTIEGGADVDTVYAFGWLNAVVGGASVRF